MQPQTAPNPQSRSLYLPLAGILVTSASVGMIILFIIFPPPELPLNYQVQQQVDKSRILVDPAGRTIIAPPDWFLYRLAPGRNHFAVHRMNRERREQFAVWTIIDARTGTMTDYPSEADLRASWTVLQEKSFSWRDASEFD